MVVTPYALLCVCKPLTTKKPFIFSSLLFSIAICTGPEAHGQDSGQRRSLFAECEAIWDARLCTCSFSVQKQQQLAAQREEEAIISVGVTPSKELCKCVFVCLSVEER